MLKASSRSSRKLGTGTSITKIRPTAAMGMIHSAGTDLTLVEGAAAPAEFFAAIFFTAMFIAAMAQTLPGAAAMVEGAVVELLVEACPARDCALQMAAKISATTV